MNNGKSFEWCGYNWKSSMEGGRIIHPKEPWMWYDSESLSIDDKGLVKLYVNDKPKYVVYDGDPYRPTKACGLMRTIEDFGYGRFSLDMVLPQGSNLWPAFWLTGSGNWPPEIDIMEAWSDDRSRYFRWFVSKFPWICPSWRTTTNVFYNTKNLEIKNISSKNVSYCKQKYDPDENPIKYMCEWRKDSIKFFINGKLVREVGEDICRQLTGNLEHQDKGWRMNVVIDVFCENPGECDVNMKTPMVVENFKYESFE